MNEIDLEKTPEETTIPDDISAFKRRREGRIILLPSGLRVKARKVELQVFIKQGQVPNGLLPIVQSALDKGKEVDISKIVDLEQPDLKMIDEMYEMVNAVVMAVTVQPKVHPVPKRLRGEDLVEVEVPLDERDDDKLYIDEFDDEDKMFLFQWSAGGTDDIATFRKEAEQSLAALAPIQNFGGETK